MYEQQVHLLVRLADACSWLFDQLRHKPGKVCATFYVSYVLSLSISSYHEMQHKLCAETSAADCLTGQLASFKSDLVCTNSSAAEMLTRNFFAMLGRTLAV